MINLGMILIIALLIESVTIFGRFLLKIRLKEVYIKLIRRFDMKYFIHFHHAFFGIIISLIAFCLNLNFFFNLGLAMILSDLVHHFIVLWIIIGNPEFHVLYKNIRCFKKDKKLEDKRLRKFFRHLIHTFK